MSTEAEIKEFLKKKDFYEILNISKTANDEEIKKAYRKLALLYHPDKNKNPSANEAFKKVAQAYDCLSNAEKRRTYDQYGSEEPEQHYQHYRQYYGESPAEQIFRAFFEQNGGFDSFFGGDIGGGLGGFQFVQTGPGMFYYSSNGNRRPRQQNHHRQRRNEQDDETYQEQRRSIQRGVNWVQISCYIIFIYIFFGGTIKDFLTYIFSESPYHSVVRDGIYKNEIHTNILHQLIYVKNEYFQKDDLWRKNYEANIDREYITDLSNSCLKQKNERDKLLYEAKKSWFANTRQQYQQQAERVNMRSCEEINQLRTSIKGFNQIFKI